MENQVNIELDQPLTTEVTYTLFDERGQILQNGVSSFTNGIMNLNIQAKGIKNGIYYLHLNQGQETKVIRLLKR